MKLILSFSMLFFLPIVLSSQSNIESYIREFNNLTKNETKDKSQIEIFKACRVEDVEHPLNRPVEEFKYNLNKVKIREPLKEDSYWSLDVICHDYNKCVRFNRDRNQMSKDFRFWEYEEAIIGYNLLITIQEMCMNRN